MYINWGLVGRALKLSLLKSPFKLRRWFFVLLFTALWAVMLGIVAVGRALDHIFFPGFRKVAVRNPVFIVAPPRSGTTLLQKLMALDEERFTYNRMYQTIFPSITWQSVIDGLVWLDSRLDSPFSKLLAKAQKAWFGGWDEMHRMRLDQPEEDDGFFVYTFVTEAIYLLFPYVNELWEAGFVDALPIKKRRKLMRYYRSCLQRRLYVEGGTVLAKATQSSGAVEALLEEFPDARFITIVRHPYKSVASHVSVFYPVWVTHSPGLAKDSEVSKEYANLAVEWFHHLFEFGRKVNPTQFYAVDFRNLTADPFSEVERIYAHFGWRMGEEFRLKLAGAARKQSKFKSQHQYTLEEFGISRTRIQERLGGLFDCYGLER